MDRLHALETFRLFSGTSTTPARLARPVRMHVQGWVGGIPDPVNGPLQAISGGTWLAVPVSGRLSLDIGLGGLRYVRSISFEPANGPPGPIAVTIHTRAKQTGQWQVVRRCALSRQATLCVIPHQQTDAIRLEFESARDGAAVGIGPLVIEMSQLQ